MNQLTVVDVARYFGRRKALSQVNFTCAAGEIVGLLGPNGAGKSTLLNILATLLSPSKGSVTYGDRTAEQGGVAVRASIGMLGHDLFLYPELTARENLEFFAGLYALKQPAASADAALERAGLAHRASDPVSSFSRGMRQRVALERALIHEPRLLLLDEPFTGLDESSADRLLNRLRSLREEGTIVVLATHDLDLAEGLFDRAIFLRDGRMAADADRPASLRAMYREVVTHAATQRMDP
jgi:heme exporter protein A